MKQRLAFSVMLISSTLILSACATTKFRNNSSLEFTPINVNPITYTIVNQNDVIYKKGLIRDLSFPSFSKLIEKGKYERLIYEDVTENSFVIHRRTDNDHAGSGIKYKVNYSIKSGDSIYMVTLKPIGSYKYQQRLVGKFELPEYDINELTNTLSSGEVLYRSKDGSSYRSQKDILN